MLLELDMRPHSREFLAPANVSAQLDPLHGKECPKEARTAVILLTCCHSVRANEASRDVMISAQVVLSPKPLESGSRWCIYIPTRRSSLGNPHCDRCIAVPGADTRCAGVAAFRPLVF